MSNNNEQNNQPKLSQSSETENTKRVRVKVKKKIKVKVKRPSENPRSRKISYKPSYHSHTRSHKKEPMFIRKIFFNDKERENGKPLLMVAIFILLIGIPILIFIFDFFRNALRMN